MLIVCRQKVDGANGLDPVEERNARSPGGGCLDAQGRGSDAEPGVSHTISFHFCDTEDLPDLRQTLPLGCRQYDSLQHLQTGQDPALHRRAVMAAKLFYLECDVRAEIQKRIQAGEERLRVSFRIQT